MTLAEMKKVKIGTIIRNTNINTDYIVTMKVTIEKFMLETNTVDYYLHCVYTRDKNCLSHIETICLSRDKYKIVGQLGNKDILKLQMLGVRFGESWNWSDYI